MKNTHKNNKRRILMIGGGISNASLARMLLDEGHYVEIREKLDRLGGMVADEYDKKSQSYLSWSGPHIINFSNETKEAEEFLKQHTKLVPFTHRVLCIGNGSFTYWPINESYRELFKYLYPKRDIFDEFVATYSKKMWGNRYKQIIAGIRDRFKPKRTRSNLFFEGKNQYQPEKGYTNMIKDLVKGARVKLGHETSFEKIKDEIDNWDHIIVTSHIDTFFDNKFGKLDFEGLDFEFKRIKTDGENLLPSPVVNLNAHPEIVRVGELNQLQAKNNTSTTRVLCFDTPSRKNRFYPIENKKNKELLNKYQNESKKYSNIFFHGRLGGYKYVDMDDCIQSSLDLFKKISR